ncbi:glycoside hydrolase family 127 protein [Cohnella sp. GbtcB17]|uniref:glycoside hydrolase family 127 protein n=1 Tax=Cohnella sp. GbtcB17 TaxID=2824762 RepID=UPI001C2F20F2|nr:glycoside hydrolase family 127 protein [Cohnella sp. GbtcB17]
MQGQELDIEIDPALSRFVGRIACHTLGAASPEAVGRRISEGIYHLTLSFRLEETVEQDDWRLEISPAFAPTFHWAPHLTPEDCHIIDQHSFRSPALIASDERQALVLVPDLDLMGRGTPVRWYMDNDAGRNRMTLGMSEYLVREHVLYERAPGAVYPAGTVQVGCYLMTFDDEETLANPWRPILSFLWERWGSPLFRLGAPAKLPLERLVRRTYDWAFDSWQDSVWQQFELDGRTVGAAAFIVNVTQSPNYPGPVNEREFRSVWNQAWFSSLRSAQGMFRQGVATGDADLLRRARLTKELALAAPQRNGLFPSIVATEMERVTADNGTTVNRSKGWETAYWGNSNRNPLHDRHPVRSAPYHLLDMSWTALLMLRWYEELEQDPRLLEYALRYADALVELQDARGFFPAWLDMNTLAPLGILDDSPETSMSVTFLMTLYRITGKSRYLRSALKAADAVASDIVPSGRWEDFETYWSCCRYGSEELVGRKVIRNDMYKQCNFSMFWTAEAFLACYRQTGDANYLKLGERCLDELLMTQASWQPPYIYVGALGGFGVMNCDGEWNDARQSLFAELIVEYGIALHREEYIERGIAALRSAFVMMYAPENPGSKAQWEKAHPFFNEKDYGFMMENYGHGGVADDNGGGMGEFTIFDWGNGAAAEGYLRMKAHHRELLERYGLCE